MLRRLLPLPLLLLGLLLPSLASAYTGVATNQYIVTYKNTVLAPGAATDQREKRDGFRASLRYSRALRGFAARLSAQQVKQLQADPQVLSVELDQRVWALGDPKAGESVPTGPRRVGAITGGASTVNVAVLDTGIDLSHPDLQAVSGTNCVTPGTPANDDHGHGTAVAGAIAARNSGSGTVGVAPGTKLYAVKVLDSTGAGYESAVLCGIDWVTANAAALNIRVVNMSFGRYEAGTPLTCAQDPYHARHQAICRLVAAGVLPVAAAGNDAKPFDGGTSFLSPAGFPEVLAVTAVADANGLPGGGPSGFACTVANDDTPASFSNYAAIASGVAHTIAAPGVCIYTTKQGGGYQTVSGTSIAAPHIAGQAAFCLGEEGRKGPCTGLSPAAIINKLRQDAEQYNTFRPSFGFAGDPLHSPTAGRYYGFLRPFSRDSYPLNLALISGDRLGGDLSSFQAGDSNLFGVAAYSYNAGWSGELAAPRLPWSALTLRLRSSAACSYNIALWNWSTSSWWSLSRGSLPASTADTHLALGLPYSDASLWNNGRIRLGVSCSSITQRYSFQTNLARVAVSY